MTKKFTDFFYWWSSPPPKKMIHPSPLYVFDSFPYKTNLITGIPASIFIHCYDASQRTRHSKRGTFNPFQYVLGWFQNIINWTLGGNQYNLNISSPYIGGEINSTREQMHYVVVKPSETIPPIHKYHPNNSQIPAKCHPNTQI